MAYDATKTEDDYGDLVPGVIFSIDLSVAEIMCDSIGTRRLGPTYRAILQKAEDLTEFELFHLFALILRTKPRDWDSDLASIIGRLDYKKWRQRSFVDLLMYDYKNEPNTAQSKAKLKHLVALVEAKRSSHKMLPGSKSVSRMQEHLEKKGRFDGDSG